MSSRVRGGVGLALPKLTQLLRPGKNKPFCDKCKDNPSKPCHECSCSLCGSKQDPDKQLMCDDCDHAFHLYCLSPPLSSVPPETEW